MFMTYALSRSELMYTKCIQNVCIQNVSHILTNVCIQNFVCIQSLAGIALLILYIKCIQKFVKIWYTFCIDQVYTSCTIFVYKMYTQFRVGQEYFYV